MLFVKRAWAWTSALYLFHLLTTPVRDTNAPRTDAVPGWVNPALHVYMPNSTRRGARAQRLATLVLSSLAWIAFTSWCFGAGIGDRIIAASGGVCAVPLPAGVDAAHVHSLLGGGAQLLSAPHKHAHSPAESAIALFLPLPAKYCLHVPLTPKTHPTLFAILEAVQSVHAASHTALHLPPPRWSGGFDVSGHAFLLTLGALILAAEVAPSWRAYRARGYTQRKGSAARLHAVATVLATALVGLWVWMLFMTAVYFHDVDEKMAGLGESNGSSRVETSAYDADSSGMGYKLTCSPRPRYRRTGAGRPPAPLRPRNRVQGPWTHASPLAYAYAGVRLRFCCCRRRGRRGRFGRRRSCLQDRCCWLLKRAPAYQDARAARHQYC